MSSCLSGGGPTYKLDLEIIKSTSTSSWTSHSSSPSSTISESSNSPLGISTRKARTPRKRPNQTYNEAAALLYAACPNIFSTKHLSKPCSSTKPSNPFSCESSSDLLLHFQAMDNSGFLLHQPILDKPSFQIEQKVGNYHEKPCQSPGEINFLGKNSLDSSDAYEEDFDAESILDEEIEEGLDSIMGNVSVNNDSVEESNVSCYNGLLNSWYGYPMGLGFGRYSDFGFGISQNVRAFRQVDNGDWWRYPAVNVADIMPKVDKVTIEKKKKKVKKTVELISLESPKENSIHRASSLSSKENSIPKSPKEDRNPVQSPGLLLKLNYNNVLKAWSNSGSPFSEEIPGSDCPGTGNDIHARLAQIDLFSESGGVREARVLRYKEKRRSRLFSKKIRYKVRKVNADQRPRMKGRFVRRPNSPDTGQRWVKSADV